MELDLLIRYSGPKLSYSSPRAIENTNDIDISEFKKYIQYRVMPDWWFIWTGDILTYILFDNQNVKYTKYLISYFALLQRYFNCVTFLYITSVLSSNRCVYV